LSIHLKLQTPLQTIRKAKRLYISGIPVGVGITKEVFAGFFETAMAASGLKVTPDGQSCISELTM
jgi:hypothetical protein